MKIALYQPWIYLHGGLEKSLLELVTRSRHEWVVYTGHYQPENTFKEFSNVDVRVLNETSVKRTITATLQSALQVGLQKIPNEQYDAITVWCDGIGDLIAYRNHELPLFNVCSTPLRAAFDPVYEASSINGKSFFYKLFYKLFKHSFKFFDRIAWSHYDGIITTSTEVKNRIIAGELCTDENKMRMAYPGVELVNESVDISYEPIILIPGRIMWTKNIQQGIKAFSKANLPKPWKLIIAGYLDEKSEVYIDELRSLVSNDVDVEFVISPSAQRLDELYRKASFCLFTPLNEDWGIVPLESMNYGKPVIANASGGPLESIANQKTGFLHSSNDIDGWIESISRLATNAELCQQMGKNAREHVKQFTWDIFTNIVDDALDEWISKKQLQDN
jgi:glycosyltransferase involved in cell wall biosynthesis